MLKLFTPLPAVLALLSGHSPTLSLTADPKMHPLLPSQTRQLLFVSRFCWDFVIIMLLLVVSFAESDFLTLIFTFQLFLTFIQPTLKTKNVLPLPHPPLFPLLPHNPP